MSVYVQQRPLKRGVAFYYYCNGCKPAEAVLVTDQVAVSATCIACGESLHKKEVRV